MKEIKIKIYGWSDFKKWLWDRFFFPRRKLVSEWLTFHNDKLSSEFERLLIKHGCLDIEKGEDLDALNSALIEWHDVVRDITSDTEKLIMLK